MRMWLLFSQMLNDIYRSPYYIASYLSRDTAIFNTNKSIIWWLLLLYLYTTALAYIHILHSLHSILFPRWYLTEQTQNTNCNNMCIFDFYSDSLMDIDLYCCLISWRYSMDWLWGETSSWGSKPIEWKERKQNFIYIEEFYMVVYYGSSVFYLLFFSKIMACP